MRYHLKAIFQEEQRKGFIVTHQISKEYDIAIDCSNDGDEFLRTYHSKNCHHLDFHVMEKNDD